MFRELNRLRSPSTVYFSTSSRSSVSSSSDSSRILLGPKPCKAASLQSICITKSLQALLEELPTGCQGPTVSAIMAWAVVGPMPYMYCIENSTRLLFGHSTPLTRAATTFKGVRLLNTWTGGTLVYGECVQACGKRWRTSTVPTCCLLCFAKACGGPGQKPEKCRKTWTEGRQVGLSKRDLICSR